MPRKVRNLWRQDFFIHLLKKMCLIYILKIMKKHILQAVFFPALCFFFNASLPLFSQALTGKNLSSYIEKSLSSKKIDFASQDLSQTGRDNFARNIYIEFKSKNENLKLSEEEKSSVILDFTQEDFFSYEEDFLYFLEDIKNSALPLNVTVLFSALSSRSLPLPSKISGEKVFAENLFSEEEYFVLCIDFSSSEKNSLLTGSYKSASPLWLCKKAADSFYDTYTPFSFPDSLASLFRLGFIHGEKRQASFAVNDIPALTLSFASVTEGFMVLKNFLLSYSPEGSSQWEKHYIFLPLKILPFAFALNERTCLIIFIFFTVMTLLSMSLASFVGKQGEKNKYELLKNLYIIPLTLLLSFSALFLSEVILRKLNVNPVINPVMAFGFKVLLSIFFISVFYALHNILKIPTDIFIYSYIVQFIAAFNIFFFALQDLMLFVPFLIEYFLFFAFRKRKNTASLLVLFVLMALPFIPYAVIILQKTAEHDIPRLIYTDFKGRLSLALLLFPFQIVYLKILMRLDSYTKMKRYPAVKIIKNIALSSFSILALCFVFMESIFIFVYNPVRKEEEKSRITVIDTPASLSSVKITKNTFSGMNTNHIKISSKKQALRYEVKIKSLDFKVPLYDSVYEYDFFTGQADNGKTAGEAVFLIPDYPPEDITIDYAASFDSRAEIELTAFYSGEGENSIIREKTSAVTGENK